MVCKALHALSPGSPPQVWGNQTFLPPHLHDLRFTPTGVGKPRIDHERKQRSAVHPHRCGETRRLWRNQAPTNGSPPQVWGNPLDRIMRHEYLRFTPTGVGKPRSCCMNSARAVVHPHRCGETGYRDAGGTGGRGSPPQVWGNPGKPGSGFFLLRFTPTGVGKPVGCCLAWTMRMVHPHRCGETPAGLALPAMPPGSPPQVWGNPTSAATRKGW